MTQVANGPINFVPTKWTFADATARGALTASDNDVYSLAYQLDNDTVWILTDASPLTWVQVNGGGGAGEYDGILTTPGDLLWWRWPVQIDDFSGETVTASSTATGTPADAMDTDEGDYFETTDPVVDEWLQVDFGTDMTLYDTRLIQVADGDHEADEVKIQSSVNGTDWTDRKTIGSPGGDTGYQVLDGAPITARYWRILASVSDGTGGWRIVRWFLREPGYPARLPWVEGRFLRAHADGVSWETMNIQDIQNVWDEDYSDGDIFVYVSADNAWKRLAAGAEGNVLTIVSGVPAWQAP